MHDGIYKWETFSKWALAERIFQVEALHYEQNISTVHNIVNKKHTEKYNMYIATVMCGMCVHRSDYSSVVGERAQYVAILVLTSQNYSDFEHKFLTLQKNTTRNNTKF